ncbi:MAG TPA: hypothetical protein ACFCUY_14900 [Xenococcaceae cyanobacterium]
MTQQEILPNQNVKLERDDALELSNPEPKSNTDFQQELEQLENIILDSTRIPLTELIVIDETLLLDRIDSLRKQIPGELAIAKEILQRQQEILKQAGDYARNIIDSAKQQADQIIKESALVRQAELEATRIKITTQRECEQLRQETKEKVEQWQAITIAESVAIQDDADEYAKNILGSLEGQLSQMLEIVRNGYQQLDSQTDPDPSSNAANNQ